MIDETLYTKYVITGKLVNGRRFHAKTTTSIYYALAHNLWQGSIWGIRKDNGKRKLLKRVVN